jgi:hypothetical protein
MKLEMDKGDERRRRVPKMCEYEHKKEDVCSYGQWMRCLSL